MKLFRVFLAHELVTQWRSVRFRGLAAVYVIVASVPAVALLFVQAQGRTTRVAGPSTYNNFLLAMQPLLTALFAAGLAVDAIARERDEGSFAVLSVAPVSSSGYVLRRWLALVAIAAPVTLVPTILNAALAVRTRQALPSLALFVDGWLIAVLPPLLVGSAMAIALGAITGRTVLAIIFGAVLITAGIGIFNNFAFYAHRSFDGPGDLFAGGQGSIRELMWTMRGFWFPRVPSDAAYPLRTALRDLPSRAGLTAAMAMVLLALSAFYLRRTRRDLRPWRIPEKHQLRTMLRTVNRIREEYTPDSGSSASDRLVLTAAVLLAALLVGSLIRRQSMFAALASQRYAAETSNAWPTTMSLVADSVRIDGEVTRAGAVRSRATYVIRNAGAEAQSHLSFMLNPMLSARGAARMRRVWERLDVELDPPLAPGQSRTLAFDVEGMPAEIDFNLQAPGNFARRWDRFRRATEAIYITDLSRSTILPAATEVRMNLRGSDVAPVLRYSAWTLQTDRFGEEGFIPEAIDPPAALRVRLAQPYPIAVDSCGTMTRSALASGCTTGLASYVIFGGPLTQRPLGAAATLAYIPAHAQLAAAQSPALASSIHAASEAWPRLDLPPHLVFVERPAEPGERSWFLDARTWRAVEQIGSRGALFFVPEPLFTTTKPIEPNIFAASIIAGTLRAKRRVAPREAAFFSRFYSALAIGRLGMSKTRAVEPGRGNPPDTAPLFDQYASPTRMAKVLAMIEYRAGADHLVEGVNDFVAHGGAGTAKELLDAIGRRAGLDLTRTYDDYFAGDALPQLTLDGVTFRRAGAQWEVTGTVKNTATGEAFVPVALRTSQGSHWQTVRVGSGGSATFAFTASGEPHSVQLDPDGVCYRHAVVGLVENVEYRGQQ